MASLQFGPADRDERGFVTVAAEPRSLADLLPTPSAIQADAQRITRQPLEKAEWVSMIVLALLFVALLVYLRSSGDARPAAPASPPAATQPRGERATSPSPIPVAMLPAYSAPDVPLGSIEATRAITPVAHFGQDWIQAIVAGSGTVWLRSSDFPQLAIVGPDLAPRPTPIPAVFVPEATAPPPPPPCVQAGIPGKMVEVCGDGDLTELAREEWIATYGGNIGVVSTPSPQIRSTP